MHTLSTGVPGIQASLGLVSVACDVVSLLYEAAAATTAAGVDLPTSMLCAAGSGESASQCRQVVVAESSQVPDEDTSSKQRSCIPISIRRQTCRATHAASPATRRRPHDPRQDPALADKVARHEHREAVRAERRHRRRCEIAAALPPPGVDGFRIRYEPRRNGSTWRQCREQVIARGPRGSKSFAFLRDAGCDETAFRGLLQDAIGRAAAWAARRLSTVKQRTGNCHVVV